MSAPTERIHLRLFGEAREIALPSIPGRATLGDLLPVARALSEQATRMAVERERREGREVSCREGCAACCRQLVPISVMEARALSRAVAGLPDEHRESVRERFALAVKRLEEIGLLDPRSPPGRMVLRSAAADPRAGWGEVVARYWAAQIPCPLLGGERCSVYEERPLVCREYLATTPRERCASLDGVRAVPRAVPGSEVLATAARSFTGETWPMLPLVLALEWTRAMGRSLDTESEGENLLNHLIAAADEVVESER